MAQYLGTVKLGGFYNNGAALARPTKPWRNDTEPYSGAGRGNIPSMSGDISNYSFGNTPSDDAKKLQWVKIKDGDKTLLICDRVILVNVTWNDLKQMAAALAYIQDNGLTDYEQLAQKATEAADRFHTISEQIKQTEQAMKTNAGLKAATVQYAKTRPVFEQYKATKYSRKFLAEHEADLELYRAAQAEMRSLLGGAKLPKMDVLKEEGRKLTAKKKQLYGEYQKARRDMQEIVTIKANIDTLMGYTEPGRKQEKER